MNFKAEKYLITGRKRMVPYVSTSVKNYLRIIFWAREFIKHENLKAGQQNKKIWQIYVKALCVCCDEVVTTSNADYCWARTIAARALVRVDRLWPPRVDRYNTRPPSLRRRVHVEKAGGRAGPSRPDLVSRAGRQWGGSVNDHGAYLL